MMTAPELIVALHNAGIAIAKTGDSLNVDGPAGSLTSEIAGALRAHKDIILATMRTLGDRSSDADWECVRAWMLDDTAKTFTPAMRAAARHILPIGEEEWPEAYSRRFRSALHVRGLLLAFPAATEGHTPEAIPAASGGRR